MNKINEKFTQDLVGIINDTAAGLNLDSNLRTIDKAIKGTLELKSQHKDSEALETIALIENTLLIVRSKISESINSLVN